MLTRVLITVYSQTMNSLIQRERVVLVLRTGCGRGP